MIDRVNFESTYTHTEFMLPCRRSVAVNYLMYQYARLNHSISESLLELLGISGDIRHTRTRVIPHLYIYTLHENNAVRKFLRDRVGLMFIKACLLITVLASYKHILYRFYKGSCIFKRDMI